MWAVLIDYVSILLVFTLFNMSVVAMVTIYFVSSMLVRFIGLFIFQQVIACEYLVPFRILSLR